MATNHDLRSHECQRIFLKNFRSGKWKNSVFSSDLLLKRTNKSWPSEDGNIVDPTHQINIALEFKPKIETKRGIQTGLGQCFTYLQNFSASYLICPKQVEGFNISNYMEKVFEKSIKGRAPIGLIEHQINNNGEIEIEMLCDIDKKFQPPSDLTVEVTKKSLKNVDLKKNEINEVFELKKFLSKDKESRYWAKFIDTNPHLIYLLLKISEEITSELARNQLIWKKFFDTYYLPEKKRNLEPFISEIVHFDKKNMEPFRDKKKALKKLVELGQITYNQALEELNEHCSQRGRPKLTKSKQNDNLYKSYMKNYMKAVDHLDLWDSNCRLTKTGQQYLEIGNKYGPTSRELFLYFGKLFLEDGNHFDLILDLESSIKNKSFDSAISARVHSQYYLEENGLYKRNPNRAVVKNRTKIFQNEFQLYRKLGILPRNEFSDNKYNFIWEEIDKYLSFKA